MLHAKCGGFLGQSSAVTSETLIERLRAGRRPRRDPIPNWFSPPCKCLRSAIEKISRLAPAIDRFGNVINTASSLPGLAAAASSSAVRAVRRRLAFYENDRRTLHKSPPRTSPAAPPKGLSGKAFSKKTHGQKINLIQTSRDVQIPGSYLAALPMYVCVKFNRTKMFHAKHLVRSRKTSTSRKSARGDLASLCPLYDYLCPLHDY